MRAFKECFVEAVKKQDGGLLRMFRNAARDKLDLVRYLRLNCPVHKRNCRLEDHPWVVQTSLREDDEEKHA